eukprot:m51a1_g5480 hypothetical protein (162) ;mRNA; r:304022-308039
MATYISTAKIPEMLSNVMLYLTGTLDVTVIPSVTQVCHIIIARDCLAVKKMKVQLEQVKYFHVLFDTSKREGLKHGSIIISYWDVGARKATICLVCMKALHSACAKDKAEAQQDIKPEKANEQPMEQDKKTEQQDGDTEQQDDAEAEQQDEQEENVGDEQT